MSDVKYDRGTIIPFHEPLSKKEVDEIINILREHPQLYYALSFSNPVIDEFIVEIMPSAILQMENPTEKLQIKAITVEPSLIRFLKKPTKAVILTALKEDGMTINFVPPTERFLTYRMHAIESNPESILVMLNEVTFPEIMGVAKDYGYVFEKCDQKYLENLLMKIKPNFKRLSDNINDKIENPGLISSMQDFYKVACSGKKPFKLNKVPKECLTEPFVYSVIRVSPGQIEYTPKKYMSDALAAVAVNSGDPLAIKYVKKPSVDLLRKAYEIYDFSITCANNIPKEFFNNYMLRFGNNTSPSSVFDCLSYDYHTIPYVKRVVYFERRGVLMHINNEIMNADLAKFILRYNYRGYYYDYIKRYADRKTIKSTIRELGPRSISAIGKKMSRYFYAVKVGYNIDEVIKHADIDEVYVTDLLLRFVRFLRKIFKKKPLNDPIYESK